jgi:hypothetical protein
LTRGNLLPHAALVNTRLPRLLLAFGFVVVTIGSALAAENSPTPFPREGIAASYRGDAGIERDSRVLFVEDFEEDSLEAMWKRWETVTDKPGMSFSDDVPLGSAGKHSLIMQREMGC